MDILILGANGQIGSALYQTINGVEVAGTTHNGLDITDHQAVMDEVKRLKPKIVINCAAFTNVDACEEPSTASQARAVNDYAVENLAHACRLNKAALIHYSTDYVFDGKAAYKYEENDGPMTVNAYGRSKLAAERHIERILDRYFILRVSTVWDLIHENFVTRMIKTLQREPVVAIPNMWSNPCYAPDVAVATIKLIKRAFLGMPRSSGVYHMVPPNHCSRVVFAEKLLYGMKVRGWPVETTKIYIRPKNPGVVTRPRNCSMSSDKLRIVASVMMPTWEQALNRALGQLKNSPTPETLCPALRV
jgi:dTDP-4-dehydrorhamnose reductase